MKNRKLDVITSQMASYFGTITKSAFIAEMLEPTYNPSSDFFKTEKDHRAISENHSRDGST